jgi:hypothetical protein
LIIQCSFSTVQCSLLIVDYNAVGGADAAVPARVDWVFVRVYLMIVRVNCVFVWVDLVSVRVNCMLVRVDLVLARVFM